MDSEAGQIAPQANCPNFSPTRPTLKKILPKLVYYKLAIAIEKQPDNCNCNEILYTCIITIEGFQLTAICGPICYHSTYRIG